MVLVYFGQAMNVSKPRHSDRGQNEATVWDATLATKWDTHICQVPDPGGGGGGTGGSFPPKLLQNVFFFNFSNKFCSFVTRRA